MHTRRTHRICATERLAFGVHQHGIIGAQLQAALEVAVAERRKPRLRYFRHGFERRMSRSMLQQMMPACRVQASTANSVMRLCTVGKPNGSICCGAGRQTKLS